MSLRAESSAFRKRQETEPETPQSQRGYGAAAVGSDWGSRNSAIAPDFGS
jgi:hypothetical protein